MNGLKKELGLPGLASIAALGAALVFSNVVVKPLEEKSAALKAEVARQAPRGKESGSADKLAAVYGYLYSDQSTTDWLARLHAIGVATGVQLKSATYRTQKTESQIVRYEIVVPVSGSYGQIRDFLKRSLEEIPVLSLDQVALKREKSNGPLQAEMRLTFHMVAS